MALCELGGGDLKKKNQNHNSLKKSSKAKKNYCIPLIFQKKKGGVSIKSLVLSNL